VLTLSVGIRAVGRAKITLFPELPPFLGRGGQNLKNLVGRHRIGSPQLSRLPQIVFIMGLFKSVLSGEKEPGWLPLGIKELLGIECRGRRDRNKWQGLEGFPGDLRPGAGAPQAG